VNDQLLIVMVADAIREDLIDALIQCELIGGFSQYEINGYSREHSRYDLSEQVAGYRRLCRFEIQHASAQEAELLALVRSICSASQARYWVVPILSAGHLGQLT
jgi:hypothetical protein